MRAARDGHHGCMQSNPDVSTLESAFTSAVAAIAPSVVRVDRRRGGGSGLVWSDDLVITSSFHTPDAPTIGVADGDDTAPRAAKVIGRDPGTDVALLQIDGGGLTAAARRDLDGVATGQLTFAVARPGRAIRASLRAIGVLGPTIRTPSGGRLDRYVETDRALARGFAGGPLIDLAGRVLGMNTRTLVPGADLAVPTATLTRVVDALRTHGRVARGYLGLAVQAAAVPAALSDQRGRGALVVAVDDGGPAAAAGLMVGDVVIAIDGAAILGPDELRIALFDRPGATVAIDLIRGGERRAITAAVGIHP